MKQPKAPKTDDLAEALWSALDESGFETLLFSDLKKKLFGVIAYKEFVALVTKSAAEQGWTDALVEAAVRQNPNNALLREFALLGPINALVAKPPDKSTAAGDEVERALNSLVQALRPIDPNSPDAKLPELNSNLADLYTEYSALVASTIA